MLEELEPASTGDNVQAIRSKLLSVARTLAARHDEHDRDQDVFELAADLMARRPAVNAVQLAVSIATLSELIHSVPETTMPDLATKPSPGSRARSTGE